jgi:hypothetical protein
LGPRGEPNRLFWLFVAFFFQLPTEARNVPWPKLTGFAVWGWGQNLGS